MGSVCFPCTAALELPMGCARAAPCHQPSEQHMVQSPCTCCNSPWRSPNTRRRKGVCTLILHPTGDSFLSSHQRDTYGPKPSKTQWEEDFPQQLSACGFKSLPPPLRTHIFPPALYEELHMQSPLPPVTSPHSPANPRARLRMAVHSLLAPYHQLTSLPTARQCFLNAASY